MAAVAERRQVQERLAAACGLAADTRTLRLQVLETLADVVAFDAHAWLLTDPETTVGGSPLADVPCPDRLPELIRLKYLTDVNRWTSMPGPVARLDAVTGGDPGRSLLWRELLHLHRVTDVASVVLRDAYGCWGFLDLWRYPDRPPFTDADEKLLVAAAPVLTAGLRRLQATTFGVGDHGGGRLLPGDGPLVIVLGPDLSVLAQTDDTEASLRAILPTEPGRPPVPATAYNVGAQLLAQEAGVDHHPPTTRLHLHGGQWVTMSAARLGSTGPVDERDIAVTLRPASPADRVAVFVRAHALTPREADVVRKLADGPDTRHLARSLGVSEHTVQDHLKSVFAKTSTGSRLELTARAFGR
jgi:DNA-binding NarL/FixJ family response regulator